MKNFLFGFILGLIITTFFSVIFQKFNSKIISPISNNRSTTKTLPLEKYQIKNLQKISLKPQKIKIVKNLKDDLKFSSYLYYSDIDTKSLGYKKNYRVSGLINIPKQKGKYPVIVMLRGFVPIENYTSGTGSRHAGGTLAQNGFITIAPDFLGYGDSEYPPVDVFEARFLTSVTAISTIKSVANINSTLEEYDINGIIADFNNIGIWAHSNGGQIALTVLEIEKKIYPTVLWAPVTKPFPYNILYYTDEYEDEGMLLRKKLAEFEKDYDARLFSTTKYLSEISSPIQLHQGTADDAVPRQWSDEFYSLMKSQKKEIEYFVYQGEDHNIARGSFSTVINRSIMFFKKYLLDNSN
ncbi:hypothetical protein A3C23_02235 [Candidatus Roizmanbacteria bacterium RIFCSPHIGHO2_02_FULL_37_13b]|uniref:Peptidase S9 prolyl oligopeptidase catalytic domain-containing protein n=1 Tax=Candidatus Roizmanbacteria bacterium RIFCSPLOWO2_02_FULL_36_11 TaxID=1802071 RepID=A0A1F7JGL5_9BACT|nr:MAG: hypothetical protein A3C23_02235 [Candidatus Roizmanbacteria bacterium RIFCSPHIGHO2_02_FULL_37_13b]OGK54754.1 MAG: hypothetical protein A3H78_05695 [Candidatus Roizmanbacteria bacterium RIFCSPLOWO2_02_FULL_36_11]